MVDPFLKAWEIESDLDLNIGTIRFKFMRADVIDRQPPPPGVANVISAKILGGTLKITGGLVNVHITRRKYPSPAGACNRRS